MLDLLIASGKDKFKVQQSLSELAAKILPEKFNDLFQALNKVATKNVYGNNKNLEKILSEEP